MILVDPSPRTPEQIFSPGSRARLEALSRVTWQEGPAAGSTLVESLLPEIWRRVGEMVADDLEALFAGRPATRLQRADPLTVGRLRSRPIG